MDEANDSFYVTLLSNANLDRHKGNKPARFTNQLETPKQLNGDWEVALKQIQYTNDTAFNTSAFKLWAWYESGTDKVRSVENRGGMTNNEWHAINDIAMDNKNLTENCDYAVVRVPPGTWKNVLDFGNYLAKLIANALKKRQPSAVIMGVKFYRNPTKVKTQFLVTGSKPGRIFLLTDRVDYMSYLGIAPDVLIDKFTKTRWQYHLRWFLLDNLFYNKHPEPKVQCERFGYPGHKTIFINSDIVCNQLVSDKHAALLQMIPASTRNESEPHFINFNNPVYVRVKPLDAINSITVFLTDANGREIPFKKIQASTIVQLHFRRVSRPTVKLN